MTPNKPSSSEAEFDFAPFGFQKGTSNTPGKSIDIVKFVLSIWKQLAIGLCAGTLLGVLVYLLLGPVYTASTRVLVSQKATVPTGDGPANTYGQRGDHVEIIKTDLVIQDAFNSHGLNEIPELANAYDPLKEVTEGLKVTRSAGQESSFDNILDIAYDHPNKVIAKRVVQAVVDAYRTFLSDTRDVNSKQIQKLLLEKQDDRIEELVELEESYQKFRREAPVFLKASPVVTINGMPQAGQSRHEAELTNIEKAQNDNARKEAGIQAKLANLERMIQSETSREVLEFWVLHSLSTGSAGETKGGGGGSSALTGPPAKAALDQQLLTARIMEQTLLNSLGDDHVSVKKIRKQIATILDFYRRQGLSPPTLDGNINPLSSRSASLGMDIVEVYRHTLNEQLEEIKLDNEKLALLHADAEHSAKEAEMFEINDQNMKDQIALKKKQLAQIYDQLAAFDVSKEQEGFRLRQIAQVRVERSLKRVLKIVGVFSILAGAMIFCYYYLMEWFDNRLQSLDELRNLIERPILGTVPKFVSSADADRLVKDSSISTSLCYFHRPGSHEAEAFRSVRTTLFHAMQANDQIVQLSSPEPGDGKSTTTANLAIAMAQSGKNVLLVDCDLRRPVQHHLFGVRQEVGLTDILLNEVEWTTAVRKTPVDGLSLVTAGLCPENPAELLSTSYLPKFLRLAKSKFDIVLLDSPPILAVSDPSIISPHVDGMLLVVRMQKNKRPSVIRTRETLEAHGVKLYGTVANDVELKSAREEGYDYHSYETYYSQEPREAAPVPVKATTSRI